MRHASASLTRRTEAAGVESVRLLGGTRESSRQGHPRVRWAARSPSPPVRAPGRQGRYRHGGVAPVVVLEITRQDSLQMPTVADQRPIQTLGTDGAHPPLGIRVGSRHPRLDLDCLDARRAEHRVERSRELGVPGANSAWAAGTAGWSCVCPCRAAGSPAPTTHPATTRKTTTRRPTTRSR